MKNIKEIEESFKETLQEQDKNYIQTAEALSNQYIHKRRQLDQRSSRQQITELNRQISILENIQRSATQLEPQNTEQIGSYLSQYRRVRDELLELQADRLENQANDKQRVKQSTNDIEELMKSDESPEEILIDSQNRLTGIDETGQRKKRRIRKFKTICILGLERAASFLFAIVIILIIYRQFFN